MNTTLGRRHLAWLLSKTRASPTLSLSHSTTSVHSVEALRPSASMIATFVVTALRYNCIYACSNCNASMLLPQRVFSCFSRVASLDKANILRNSRRFTRVLPRPPPLAGHFVELNDWLSTDAKNHQTQQDMRTASHPCKARRFVCYCF
jgi:hypothetical protein